MKYLTEIELTNIVYFKNARFKFERGLTFVQGRNMQRRGGGQASNGSGKSLLFGVLPNLLLDAHPTITKNSRTVQKQLYGKGSKASMSYKTDPKSKNKYTYTKAGSKVALALNGKNLESRIARDQVKSHLDFSEEEFFSTVYLDSRRENKFQIGTAADRYAYITSLFRLHNLDDFRKHVNKQISTLRGDESILSQTSLDLEAARRRLVEIPPEIVEQAQAESAWLQSSTNRLQSMQSLVHQWETYNKYLAAVAELEKLEPPKHSQEKLRTGLRRLDQYEAKLEAWTEQSEAQEQRKAKLRKLKIDDSELDAMNDSQDALKAFAITTKPKKPETERSHADKYADKQAQTYVDRRHSARAAKTSATALLAKFDREVGDSDECPTCHSELSAATKKAVRVSLKAAVTDAQQQIDKLDKIITGIEAAGEWQDYDVAVAEYAEFVKAYAVIDGYDFEGAAAYRQLKHKLSTPLPDKPEPVTVNREAVERQLARWRVYETAEERVQTLKCDEPEAGADGKAIAKLQQQIKDRMSGLSELQTKAADRKALVRQIKELRQRHEELTTALEDLPVYKMLNEAYSTAGLKTMMVQRIATALETNLNRYAKTIFSEDFVFGFDVADGHFNVMVSRKAEGKTIISDIRHMSGAESRLFIFLFVMALLPLMPANRRMNVMIMDEPDANMDVETREIFRDKLLPRLAKVVPCLIVISPNSDIVPQHARVVTVVKNGGESKLIEGMYVHTPLATAALAGASAIGHRKKSTARSAHKPGLRGRAHNAGLSQDGKRRRRSQDAA